MDRALNVVVDCVTHPMTNPFGDFIREHLIALAAHHRDIRNHGLHVREGDATVAPRRTGERRPAQNGEGQSRHRERTSELAWRSSFYTASERENGPCGGATVRKPGPFNVSANARRRRSPSTLASDAERFHRAWGRPSRRPSFIRMPSVVRSRLARQVASHGRPDFVDKADVWRRSPHASVVRSGSFSFQLSPSVKVVENVGATNGVSSVSEAGDVVVRVRRRSRSAFLLPLSILRP
jgi:hypothetical protein